jgi:hypothetical protein
MGAINRTLRAWLVRFLATVGVQSNERLDVLPLYCGLRNSRGIDEVPEWRDWTDQETTPDQLRIEDVLSASPVKGTRILHVGVGNSSLATKFHDLAKQIDGLTLQENELRFAKELAIDNYLVELKSKFSPDLALGLAGEYDYVVDNNPTTFCCCRRHFSYMLANYTVLLNENGIILTDVIGLGWTSQPNDSRWGLSADEWWAIGGLFSLNPVRLTDQVIGLRKSSNWSVIASRLRRSCDPGSLLMRKHPRTMVQSCVSSIGRVNGSGSRPHRHGELAARVQRGTGEEVASDRLDSKGDQGDRHQL